MYGSQSRATDDVARMAQPNVRLVVASDGVSNVIIPV